MPVDELNVDHTPRLISPELRRKEWLFERLKMAVHAHEAALSDFVSDIRVANTAAYLIWAAIKHLAPGYLIGAGLQSMQLLHAVAFAALQDGHRLRVLMIRETRKGHNRKKWIEGEPPKQGAHGVYVSDFFANEESFSFAQQALLAENYSMQVVAMAAICCLGLSLNGVNPLTLPPIHAVFGIEEIVTNSSDASIRFLLAERHTPPVLTVLR